MVKFGYGSCNVRVYSSAPPQTSPSRQWARCPQQYHVKFFPDAHFAVFLSVTSGVTLVAWSRRGFAAQFLHCPMYSAAPEISRRRSGVVLRYHFIDELGIIPAMRIATSAPWGKDPLWYLRQYSFFISLLPFGPAMSNFIFLDFLCQSLSHQSLYDRSCGAIGEVPFGGVFFVGPVGGMNCRFARVAHIDSSGKRAPSSTNEMMSVMFRDESANSSSLHVCLISVSASMMPVQRANSLMLLSRARLSSVPR